jgi:hypothetical protein
MTYKISRWHIENSLETFGDDWASFHVYFAKDNAEMMMPIIVPLEHVLDHIQKTAPAEYQYIKDIKKNIRGYGPKHSRILKALDEEGYDFSPHLQGMFNQDQLAEHAEYNKRLATLPVNKELEKKMAELDEMVANMKESNKKYVRFLDAIDKQLHELTFEFYPELFEKGEAIVERYEYKLGFVVRMFAEAIDKLLHGKLE